VDNVHTVDTENTQQMVAGIGGEVVINEKARRNKNEGRAILMARHQDGPTRAVL
jgi:hypothetical protein